jgi:hypothetical protein
MKELGSVRFALLAAVFLLAPSTVIGQDEVPQYPCDESCMHGEGASGGRPRCVSTSGQPHTHYWTYLQGYRADSPSQPQQYKTVTCKQSITPVTTVCYNADNVLLSTVVVNIVGAPDCRQ